MKPVHLNDSSSRLTDVFESFSSKSAKFSRNRSRIGNHAKLKLVRTFSQHGESVPGIPFNGRRRLNVRKSWEFSPFPIANSSGTCSYDTTKPALLLQDAPYTGNSSGHSRKPAVISGC